MSDLDIRTREEAEFIVKTQYTLRQTAEFFGVSKSTIHNDLKYRLPKLDAILYNKVNAIFRLHFEQKHIKGGMATKAKKLKNKCMSCEYQHFENQHFEC